MNSYQEILRAQQAALAQQQQMPRSPLEGLLNPLGSIGGHNVTLTVTQQMRSEVREWLKDWNK